MNRLDLENLIYECLDGFPKNTSFYSDQAKRVIAKAIAEKIRRKK
jgi:hypothetical protein